MAEARASERIADCRETRVLERFVEKHAASPRRTDAEARLLELADTGSKAPARDVVKPSVLWRGVAFAAYALAAVAMAAIAAGVIFSSDLVCQFAATTRCLHNEIEQTGNRERLREIATKYPYVEPEVADRVRKLDWLKEKIARSSDREWLLNTSKEEPALLSLVLLRIAELDAPRPDVIQATPMDSLAVTASPTPMPPVLGVPPLNQQQMPVPNQMAPVFDGKLPDVPVKGGKLLNEANPLLNSARKLKP
jgi:hypothetical protein